MCHVHLLYIVYLLMVVWISVDPWTCIYKKHLDKIDLLYIHAMALLYLWCHEHVYMNYLSPRVPNENTIGMCPSHPCKRESNYPIVLIHALSHPRAIDTQQTWNWCPCHLCTPDLSDYYTNFNTNWGTHLLFWDVLISLFKFIWF